ncbi:MULTISPECIES: hypothetical protein [unclassified Streptomyces]|uniref:hypothetical protein n=1 Tax=unclassified Streptomyces TaxID=2593676 RepID=UPI0038164068
MTDWTSASTSFFADGLTNDVQQLCSGAHADVTPLPLRLEAEPAFELGISVKAITAAGLLVRQRVRPWLTIGSWEGDVDVAARIADKLVDNAVKHGEPFPDGTVTLRLIVDAKTRGLRIEVDDAFPDFPGFGEVANHGIDVAGKPHGLQWVTHYKGCLSWDAKADADGKAVSKTVRAILSAD